MNKFMFEGSVLSNVQDRTTEKGGFMTARITDRRLVTDEYGNPKSLFNCSRFVTIYSPEIIATINNHISTTGETEFIVGHQYRDWETDRKSTRLNSSHRL